MTRTGKLSIVQIEPLDYSPDEFAGQVRQEVEDREARIVMVDSVVGYQLSLRHRDLDRHLHALCRYLRNMGVTTILIRGYDPYDDAVDYGRHLLPLVRTEVARRDGHSRAA